MNNKNTNRFDFHWLEGGTALTNFRPEEEEIYLEAIKKYGDSSFVISHRPMNKRGSISTDYSLHYLEMPIKHDCSNFWKVFREVKSKRELARVEKQK